jgi:uncharacterized protein (UPF0276 family)
MRPDDCHGAGLGLRPAHLHQVCREQPAVPWFEVHICNFLGGGLNRALLHHVAESYPLSFHGVNLNLGGTDPLDEEYLGKLGIAVDEFQPALVSEHACFTVHHGLHFHDLLPLPYTWEGVEHLASRIRQVQDHLRRPILIENISRYYAFPESELSEGEFLSAVCRQSGCGLLLDLNNAYVNQCNLGLDLMEFTHSLPLEQVQEVHLGGYSRRGEQLIDSHCCAPGPAVWDYFAAFCELKPDVPCLIEWDNALPPFAELVELQLKANKIMGESGAGTSARCSAA